MPPFVMRLVLTALVLATIHRAETVADRVGEPHRARILAISVTVISLGLILPILLAIGALVIVPKSTAVVRAADANHLQTNRNPARGRTTVLHCAAHLAIFAVYLVMPVLA